MNTNVNPVVREHAFDFFWESATGQETASGNKTVNAYFVKTEQMPKKNWSEWSSEQFQTGLGVAIQNLVSGVIIGLGQILIQLATDKVTGSSPTNEPLNTDDQELKIAMVTQDCNAILETDGNIKKSVLKVLAKAEKSETNNYPAYLTGVATCRHERMKKNNGNTP